MNLLVVVRRRTTLLMGCTGDILEPKKRRRCTGIHKVGPRFHTGRSYQPSLPPLNRDNSGISRRRLQYTNCERVAPSSLCSHGQLQDPSNFLHCNSQRPGGINKGNCTAVASKSHLARPHPSTRKVAAKMEQLTDRQEALYPKVKPTTSS